MIQYMIFIQNYAQPSTGKIQIYRKKPPQRILGEPCRLRQVLMIRIWLHFYEDDMSPWVLSSIHIQRLRVSKNQEFYTDFKNANLP
jgi:hypothetical protein